MPARFAFWLALAAFAAGCALRWPGLPYLTSDATLFLQPWYAFALAHGRAGLGEAFTNYTPAFSYLLLAATHFDGHAQPIALIKSISFVFEFGSALVGAAIVRRLDPSPVRAAVAFALLWTAPTVILNGSVWGQADAIWTFCLLLTLLALLAQRPGLAAIAFGLAFAVKAQAIFLAPLGLALVINRTIRPAWMLALPAVYLILALPVLVAGRPFGDVATIYLQQSSTYSGLSRNAANLYLFADPSWYGPVLVVGLAAAALAALAFAIRVGRTGAKLPADVLILAAAVSLILMPVALPKMHDRYFYAFEIVILVLAVARPGLGIVAAVAQLTAGLAYFPMLGLNPLGLPLAALLNLAILVSLGSRLSRALSGRDDAFAPAEGFRRTFLCLLVAYMLQLLCLSVASAWIEAENVWPADPTDRRGLIGYGLLVVFVLAAGRRLGAIRGRVPELSWPAHDSVSTVSRR